MKSIGRGGWLLAGAMLALAGCGSVDGNRDSGPAVRPAPVGPSVVDGPPKLGAPYVVAGTTYTPADVADYDDVGYASWYGEELAGKPTAIGEAFDPDGITAAHKTLPLPSYVEVTALDTGRTILVRVNDRGPMVNDRLIDLSRGAAQQLGLDGVSGVRVRRTNPPASEKAQLRSGEPVPARLATPGTLLTLLRAKLKDMPVPAGVATATASKSTSSAPAPGADRFIVEGPGAKAAPAATPVASAAKPAAAPPAAKPAPAVNGAYAVQVAAFSSESRANAAAKSVGGSVSKAGNLWRVRMGPFATEADALAAQAKAKAKGFGDAQVQRDR